MTPSQIGVILRDSHGIAQVKSVAGSKILRVLKAHGLDPEIREDLYHLIKKGVAIRKHLVILGDLEILEDLRIHFGGKNFLLLQTYLPVRRVSISISFFVRFHSQWVCFYFHI